ncbi:hypothetical protein ID866_5589 [Astraeus odoratus]|nr:hypothetical protein ID866_5589 [Astraeus odoratus]
MSRSRVHEYAIATKMLRYPICDQEVLEAYFRMTTTERESLKKWVPELPKRLFYLLGTTKSNDSENGTSQWTERDHPLPFLRYLYSCPHIHPPAVNSHNGYALTKAVQARFIPLARFLLNHGATPDWKNNLAVRVAIHHKDLQMVRMLVERPETGRSPEGKVKGKRRRLEDRVLVTPEMLRAAVKCKAQDIVEYFTREKGCIPDMQTLLLMQ